MPRLGVVRRLTLVAAGLFLLIGGFMLGPRSHAQGLGVFEGEAGADGTRIGVAINNFLVVDQLVDGAGPSAQATVNGFGDSKGYAALPYPGDVVLTAHGLSMGAAPDYPLIAQSSYPTQPKSTVGQGPYVLTSASDADTSNAAATAGGAIAKDQGAAYASATSQVLHDEATDATTATAESTATGISFGADVLRIGRVHSFANVVARAGAPAQMKSDTEVADVSIAGQEVGFTDKGLVIAGTDTPLPPDSTLGDALAGAGISVHYLAGQKTANQVIAPGVAISVTQDVAGNGTAVITYTFGQSSAYAKPGVTLAQANNQQLSIPAVLPPAAGPPTATGGGTTMPAVAPAATGATVTNAAPPVVAGNRQVATRAVTPTWSVAAWYAATVVGALLALFGAQIFRLISVRLAWTS